MNKSLKSYLFAALLLPLSGTAFGSVVPSIDFTGNWSLTNTDGLGIYETLTFTNPFGSGAGAVSNVNPKPDGLLGDPGEFIANSAGGSIQLTLDQSNFTSGSRYAFNPTTYSGGFSLFDNGGTLLFTADLTATELLVQNTAGSINSIFDLNLTNITKSLSYVLGTSAIVDAFLPTANPGGAANFTLQMSHLNIADAIEKFGGSGSYSGSASVIPIPAALPLFLSALVALGFVRRRRRSHA